MSSNSIDDSNPRLPRHKESPRTNAFNQVISIIDAHMKEWSGAMEAQDILTFMRKEVQALIGTPHIVRTPRVKKEDKVPEADGSHYVGVLADGSAVYVKNMPDDLSNFAHMYGAFRTASGAAYSIEHNTYTTRPMLF